MKSSVALALLAGCQVAFPVDLEECLVGNDEDGDRIDDGCDNCPTVANANQLDMFDGDMPDGVGDACDPNKAQPGDRIAYFESFANEGDELRWSDISRQWNVVGGTLVHSGMGLELSVFDSVEQMPAPPYRVETHLTVTGFPLLLDSDVGVTLDADGAGHGARCSIKYFGDPNNEGYAEVADDATPGLSDGSVSGIAVTAPEGFTLIVDYEPVHILCTVVPDDVNKMTNQAELMIQARPIGKLGFVANDMDAIVDNVIVYAH